MKVILCIMALLMPSVNEVQGAVFKVSNEQELQSALFAAASNYQNDTIKVAQGGYEVVAYSESTEAKRVQGLSAFDKYKRVLLKEREDKKARTLQESTLRPLLKPLLSFLENGLSVVATYKMEGITSQGIQDLTWDGEYFWGIDGGALVAQHYVVKIDPSTFKILSYFPAPNESWIADGSDGIAYGAGYLWVLNYLDEVIYAVTRNGDIDYSKTIDISGVSSDVTSGGCWDGQFLWFIMWGSSSLKLCKVDINRKKVVSSIELFGYNTGCDLEYIDGYLWITAESTEGYYYFLRVDPNSGKVIDRYDRDPCKDGIAYDGTYLIVADWCEGKYYQYKIRSSHTYVNLRPYQPLDWDDKIVVSAEPGTHRNSEVYQNRIAYIDVAWENNGNADAGVHRVRLYLDGSEIMWSEAPGLSAGYYRYGDDWQYTFTEPGWHTLKLVVDADNQVIESNEEDNEYSRLIYVNPEPLELTWPAFQGDPQHTGRSQHPAVEGKPIKKWKFSPGEELFSPVISDTVVYIQSEEKLYAVDMKGKAIWELDLQPQSVFNTCSPAIGSDGTVYAESGGILYAVSPTGTVKWKFELEGDGCSPIVGPDGVIYVGGGSKLYAITSSGQERWEYDAGTSITSIPAVSVDGTIYIGTETGRIYAIDSDGALKWPFDMTEKVSVQVDYMEEIPSAILHILSKWNIGVVDVALRNRTSSPVTIKAYSEIIGYTDPAIATISLEPGRVDTVSLTPQFKPGILDQLTELKTADLYWKITSTSGGEEEVLDEQTKSILLYAKDTMIWGETTAEGDFIDLSPFIVAWVTPHAEAVKELISKAKNWHPERQLVGYQGGNSFEEQKSIVWEQVKAIYNALKYDYDITYVSSIISYPTGTQRVRLPSESLKYGTANCIDGAVLFASALEAIDIDPYICLVPGHAFVAWDWWEDSEYVGALETTMIADYTADEAFQIGIEEYQQAYDEGTLKLISIEFLRELGLTPMEKPAIVQAGIEQRKGIYSSPTISSDGTIYFGSENGMLYAVSSEGQQKWGYDLGEATYSSPAIDQKGVIYAGSDAGVLYAIYPNGHIKWEFQIGVPIRSSPVVDSMGTVYLGAGNKLYAISSDGSEKWEIGIGEVRGSSPAIGPDGVIYIGTKDGLYAIAGKEGETPSPVITLSATSYDFGDVKLGTYAYWNLVIGNEGEAPLSVDSITSSDSSFSVLAPEFPQSVPPGETIEVKVGFFPSEAKVYQATLSISSNDPDRPEITVSLKGVGVTEGEAVSTAKIVVASVDTSITPFELYFGVHPDGTDGYDQGLDVLSPPPSPGANLDVYFAVSGLFGRLSTDIRSSEKVPVEWTLVVDSGTDFSLSWDISGLPSRYTKITLADTIDMKMRNTARFASGRYTFLIVADTTRYVSISILLRAGWNLVSIPVVPSDATLKALFPEAVVAYSWDGSRYIEVDSLQVSKGYWIAMAEDRSYTIEGEPVASYTTDITAGWNLIGSCSQATTDLTTEPPGCLVSGTLYAYDPEEERYVPASRIEPGKGYWVASLKEGKLMVGGGGVAKLAVAEGKGRLSDFLRKYGPPPPPPEIGASVGEEVPLGYRLYPPSPNPFNSSTNIAFYLPSGGRISLRVYDILGRVVRVLAEGEYSRGSYVVAWDGRDEKGKDMASGVYVVGLLAEGKGTWARKVVLTR